MPLKDVEVRKAASALTTLANEKQKEQREKASGKKKPKAAGKPALGATKATNKSVIFAFVSMIYVDTHFLVFRFDTNAYEESLDDFGSHPDDFM